MKITKNIKNLGTESAFEVLARAEKLRLSGKEVINLGIGQPDFPTPKHIVEAAVKALRDGKHGYTPANGIKELREAVCEDILKYRKVSINPDNIIIMPGGKPVMFFTILMFGEIGAEIMYPNPGFPIYESMIRFSGAKPIPIELNEKSSFSFSADNILSKITDKTKLIIINSPANPTGGIAEKSELDKLVNGLQKYKDIAILSDEIYSRMIYDGVKHNSLLNYQNILDRLIVLDGWSKTYAMTGWRIGWSYWPNKLIEYATRLAINDHSCVNASAQWAGLAALQGPQKEVDKMMEQFDLRRNLIVQSLNNIPGITCQIPKGAFYVFPKISELGISSNEAQDLFLNEAGVASVSGTAFGQFGEGYLRFSYAASKEDIEKAIHSISNVIARKFN
ncbi:pyridoxal phosphate-dependent aminotransferase [Alphaproteobacteria bacterium]|nr:pyridoxal phosphate-dependent aminotransferase [Alphaproteobacteria bacterium]